MPDESTIEKARYILSTGKRLYDRIMDIQSQYLAACEMKDCHELSMSQLHAVRVVRECGEASMSELAEKMGVSPPSASAMVDRLVDKGVLWREHSTEDRRKVVVRISPEAEKNAESIESGILQLFVELVNKLGPETTQQWCDVLSRVISVLSDIDQDSLEGKS